MNNSENINYNIDYYKVLELDYAATPDQIKKAYFRLAKLYHPDRNKASDASQKFQEIKTAYDILSNSQLKLQYDNYFFHRNNQVDQTSFLYSDNDQMVYDNEWDWTDIWGFSQYPDDVYTDDVYADTEYEDQELEEIEIQEDDEDEYANFYSNSYYQQQSGPYSPYFRYVRNENYESGYLSFNNDENVSLICQYLNSSNYLLIWLNEFFWISTSLLNNLMYNDTYLLEVWKKEKYQIYAKEMQNSNNHLLSEIEFSNTIDEIFLNLIFALKEANLLTEITSEKNSVILSSHLVNIYNAKLYQPNYLFNLSNIDQNATYYLLNGVEKLSNDLFNLKKSHNSDQLFYINSSSLITHFYLLNHIKINFKDNYETYFKFILLAPVYKKTLEATDTNFKTYQDFLDNVDLNTSSSVNSKNLEQPSDLTKTQNKFYKKKPFIISVSVIAFIIICVLVILYLAHVF